MDLIHAFGIEDVNNITIAFTGAGGKSSIMYGLAGELAGKGFKVLVTTTTKILHPDIRNRPCSIFFTGPAKRLLKHNPPEKGSITVAGKELTSDGQKIIGYKPGKLKPIQRSGFFDIILVEADGARGKPIKAPSAKEPVIPADTDILAGVIGMDCVGTLINDSKVHRSDIFAKVTSAPKGSEIDAKVISGLIRSPVGIFKGASQKSRKIVILNKCDNIHRITKATEISNILSSEIQIDRILFTSMNGNIPVKKVVVIKGA